MAKKTTARLDRELVLQWHKMERTDRYEVVVYVS